MPSTEAIEGLCRMAFDEVGGRDVSGGVLMRAEAPTVRGVLLAHTFHFADRKVVGRRSAGGTRTRTEKHTIRQQ